MASACTKAHLPFDEYETGEYNDKRIGRSTSLVSESVQ